MHQHLFILTLICVIYNTANAHIETHSLSDECSTCQMPCIATNPDFNMTSLIRAYTTSYKDYTITTLLNGIQGYFQTTVSLKGKERQIHSARVNLEDWPFRTLCKILSYRPVVTDSKKTNVLYVRYNTFKTFKVYLKTKFFDNFLSYVLAKKIAILQEDIVDVKENSFPLQDLKTTSKLKDAIRNSRISGFSGTNIFLTPGSNKYCYTATGKWLHIDLREEFLVNFINFRLYEGYGAVFTYNLQVSSDNTNWKDIAIKKTGTSIQNFPLPELMRIRYIKMEGTNTKNKYLSLLYFNLDLV